MALSFNDLKKNLRKDASKLKGLNIALLGDSATQLLAKALIGYGFEVGYNFKLFDADYNQIEQMVFDATSELYKSKFDFIIIAQSTEKLLKKFYKLDLDRRREFSDAQLRYFQSMYDTLSKGAPAARVILYNFTEIDDTVFGNYANKTDSSFLYQLRSLNVGLMTLCRHNPNLFICDICSLQNQNGRAAVCDQKTYVTADMVFSLDFLPLAARRTTDIILSVSGVFKKALILDLDNTLWGGVIGDDGLESIQIGDLGNGKAFSELQAWILELKKRGIILAVCSKNTDHIAKEPFEKHPDMVLSLSDIAVFVANWNNKADNIAHIQSILNIGFDSMVFLDDNPAERELVRANIPQLTVPELPEDPSEYLPYLRSLNLFETASFSGADTQRTRQYQEEAARAKAQQVFANEDEFLGSLEMTAEISPFNPFNTPRIAQLTLRSNQFNLRTRRYTEDDIRAIAKSDKHFHFAFNLKDKFGEYGLISVVVLEKKSGSPRSLFIDSWLMSCRVLKRGMENLVLNALVRPARKNGYDSLVGEYLPTPKNGIVKDHYPRLGFEQVKDLWMLDVKTYRDRPHFIKIVTEEK